MLHFQQLSPQANAGANQITFEDTTVVLDGTASTATTDGSTIVAYSWNQVPSGIPMTLNGADTATPTFTSPFIQSDTILAFTLAVMVIMELSTIFLPLYMYW